MSRPSTRLSVPPLSMRDRSSSSLTICTRWPVSTSILPIRSRIFGGRPASLASASRDSVSASRLTVVSGVRSSCDRLSMNSVRIRCSRRSSETSSTISHSAAAGGRAGRSTVRVGPSASARRTSVRAVPLREGGLRHRLDARVEERLHHRATRRACPAPGRAARARPAFAAVTRSVAIDAQRRPEPTAWSRLSCSAAACAISSSRCAASDRRRRIAAQRAGQGAGVADARCAASDDREDGQPQADGDPRVHGSSIAQPRPARRSGRSSGPYPVSRSPVAGRPARPTAPTAG